MAKKTSAGILVYRGQVSDLEVFLVHPGGPFWEKKDDGAWSIPKGEFEPDEDPLTAAKREFHEETSFEVVEPFLLLTPIKQPSGKMIHAWAVSGDFDPTLVKSNLFAMEWPPRSGVQKEFPEVDRAQWFKLPEATAKLLKGQRPFLEELRERLQSKAG